MKPGEIESSPDCASAILGPDFAAESAGGFNLWPLFSISWAHFLNDGASNYLPAVLPAVLVTMHIPVALVGVVMAALLAGQVLQPLCGLVADRLGGRSLVLIGVAASTLGGALIGIAPSYSILICVLLAVGMGGAVFHPQALAVVRQIGFGSRQGLFLSTFLVGGELGRGLWPMLASLIVVHFGLHALIVLALPTLFTLPLVIKEMPSVHARTNAAPRLSLNHHGRPLAILVGYSGLRAAVTYSLTTFLPLMWAEKGGSLVGGASLITTLLTAGIFGNLAGGHLSDRFSRKSVVIATSILSAVLLVILLLVQGPILWVILGLLGMAMFATFPLQVLIAQDILPDNRALGSGLALGFSNGIGAAAMMLFGPVAARWGIPFVLWSNVGLAIAAVAAATFLPPG
ncbi:MAG TPA: MFS transporter [Candidatus Binataceae bacterium]|nr:MFS transporter [Candidatus Binataceae bacterium]